MSEPSEAEDEDIRQHPQDPAEGPDEEQRETEDVPRVHAEDPAEG